MKNIHSRSFFIILIGLPAAGKSSLAKSLQNTEFFRTHQLSVEIVDTDIIRSHIEGSQFQPDKEQMVKKAKISQIRTCLAENRSVIVDDMHYYESMRHDLFEIHREFSSYWISIYLNTPLSMCIEWNRQRATPLPESVIYTVSKKWDKPGVKYSWDRPTFIYSPHLSTLDSFNYQFNLYLENMLRDSTEIQKITTSSESDLIIQKTRVDSITRQIIAVIIQNRENLVPSSELAEIYRIFTQKWQIDISHPQFTAQVASLRIPFKQWWLSQQRDLPTLSDFLDYLHSTD